MEALEAFVSTLIFKGHPADCANAHYKFQPGCKSSLLPVLFCFPLGNIQKLTGMEGFELSALETNSHIIWFVPRSAEKNYLASRLTEKGRVSPFLKISL